MSYIILDRDGVINYDSDEYIKSPEEWRPIPGSLEAIAQLNRYGFRVVVATNQSGLARGLFDLETLSDIHNKLHHELAAVGGYVEEIFFCPHHPDQQCMCRKPKPGMLNNISSKYKINLQETYFVGDSYSDVQAAWAAGCLPILIKTSKGIKALESYPELNVVPNFNSLTQAVDYVIAETRDKSGPILSI